MEQTECSETSAYKIQTPRGITQKKTYNNHLVTGRWWTVGVYLVSLNTLGFSRICVSLPEFSLLHRGMWEFIIFATYLGTVDYLCIRCLAWKKSLILTWWGTFSCMLSWGTPRWWFEGGSVLAANGWGDSVTCADMRGMSAETSATDKAGSSRTIPWQREEITAGRSTIAGDFNYNHWNVTSCGSVNTNNCFWDTIIHICGVYMPWMCR